MYSNQIFQWQTETLVKETMVPVSLHKWLFNKGSFMLGLNQAGVHDAEIAVIQEGWHVPDEDEADLLGMKGSEAFIREVLIKSPAQDWMLARSVFPKETLTGELKALANLQNQSLGSIIFKDPNLKRTEFTVSLIHGDTVWQQNVAPYFKQASQIFARRSQFFSNNKTLLLTEIFLPDIYNLC
jgi:chorismate--pyruvate lyase